MESWTKLRHYPLPILLVENDQPFDTRQIIGPNPFALSPWHPIASSRTVALDSQMDPCGFGHIRNGPA